MRVDKKSISIMAALIMMIFSTAVFAQSQKKFPSEQEYLSLSDDKIDLAEAALIMIKGCHSELDIQKYLDKVDLMAKEIKEELKGAKGPSEVIKAINTYLFAKQNLAYEKETYFLSDTLDNKKGNCLSFSMLYLSIIDRLGLPSFYGVNAPIHIFVRYDDGKTKMNIETTDKGAIWPDEKYINRTHDQEGLLNIPAVSIAQGVFLKNLTKKEVLANLFVARAHHYMKSMKYDKAIDDCNAALSLNPNDANAYTVRGNAYSYSENYDLAIRDSTKALELDPEYGKSFCVRGRAWFFKKEYDKAIADLDEGIKRMPKFVEARESRVKVFFEKKEYDKAIEDLNTIIKLQPDNVSAYIDRGRAWNKKGLYDNAIADFNQALKLKPEEILAYHHRAWSWLGKEEYDKALSDLKSAKGKMPFDMPDNYYPRGLVLMNKKEYAQAIAEFNQALSFYPKDASIYNVRAITYFYMQEYQKSWEDVHKAQSLGLTIDAGFLERLKLASGKTE